MADAKRPPSPGDAKGLPPAEFTLSEFLSGYYVTKAFHIFEEAAGPKVRQIMKDLVGPEDKRVDVDAQILQHLNDMKNKHDQKQAELTASLKSLGYVDDGKTDKMKFLRGMCSGTHRTVLPLHFYLSCYPIFILTCHPLHPRVDQICLERIKLFKPYAV